MVKEDIIPKIAATDWQKVQSELLEKGAVLIPGFLDEITCTHLTENYEEPRLYRKKVIMEQHRFGYGEYKYFNDPLPELIGQLRASVYERLVPVANQWMQRLETGLSFPARFEDFRQQCRDHGQHKTTALILKYGPGGYNTLHQDLYGDVFFPMQMTLFLNEPDKEYSGGEFVLVKQIPRAQSEVTVWRPGKGDLLIFATRYKPEKSTRGYYRATMKHGVSEVRHGERFTLGIIFHDALS